MSTVEFVQLCSKEQVWEFFAEFNATEESVKKDVEYLKDWMRKQPHLPNIEDEDWLMNFLLRNKNSLEKTKKSLEGYYTTRALMPEVFTNRDPTTPIMEKLFFQGCYIPARKLTPDGYRIVMFRIFDSKCNYFDADNVVKGVQMVTDYSLKADKFRGMIVIYDFENINMNYITMLFSILRKLMTLGTKTTPCRYHKIYIINLIPAVEPMINLAKTIIKKELADRIQIWKGKPTELVNVLPREVLPENYGGDEKPLEKLVGLWYEDVKKQRDWFLSDEKNKADLSKRPIDSTNNTDLTEYGVEGSFRKICLD